MILEKLNEHIEGQVCLVQPIAGSVSISHVGTLDGGSKWRGAKWQVCSNMGSYAILFSVDDVKDIQDTPFDEVSYQAIITLKSPSDYK